MTDIRVIEKSDDREKDLRQKLANGSTSSIKTIFNSEMHETAHAYDASCASITGEPWEKMKRDMDEKQQKPTWDVKGPFIEGPGSFTYP